MCSFRVVQMAYVVSCDRGWQTNKEDGSDCLVKPVSDSGIHPSPYESTRVHKSVQEYTRV